VLLLAGCGGSRPEERGPPVDRTLERDTAAGHVAFELEHPDEAAAKYRAALERAQARDDLEQIGTLGYNLAVAELQANAPERALGADDVCTERIQESYARAGAAPLPLPPPKGRGSSSLRRFEDFV
jgi:hypothetical protein